MTAALRKVDSPRSRRSRQRVSAKYSSNSSNKVAYLPYVSPQELSSPLNQVRDSQVEKRNFASLNSQSARGANPWAKPMWLRSLLGANQVTAIATLVLVSAVLGIYGQVVHTKQHWGREYRQLERLQKEERQITTFNEALKNDIAQTAKQEGTGLVTPDGSQMIILEPTPTRSLRENVAAPQSTVPSKQPLGY